MSTLIVLAPIIISSVSIAVQLLNLSCLLDTNTDTRVHQYYGVTELCYRVECVVYNVNEDDKLKTPLALMGKQPSKRVT